MIRKTRYLEPRREPVAAPVQMLSESQKIFMEVFEARRVAFQHLDWKSVEATVIRGIIGTFNDPIAMAERAAVLLAAAEYFEANQAQRPRY